MLQVWPTLARRITWVGPKLLGWTHKHRLLPIGTPSQRLQSMPLQTRKRDPNRLQDSSPGPRHSLPLLISRQITNRGWGSLVQIRMSLHKLLKNLAARSKLETILWSYTRRPSIWIERFYTLTRTIWERCNLPKTQIVEKDKVASTIKISKGARQKSYRTTHLLAPL